MDAFCTICRARLGGPGGPGDPSNGWGAKPPTFWKGLRGPRGRRDPPNDRIPILNKFNENYSPPKCSHVQCEARLEDWTTGDMSLGVPHTPGTHAFPDPENIQDLGFPRVPRPGYTRVPEKSGSRVYSRLSGIPDSQVHPAPEHKRPIGPFKRADTGHVKRSTGVRHTGSKVCPCTGLVYPPRTTAYPDHG